MLRIQRTLLVLCMVSAVTPRFGIASDFTASPTTYRDIVSMLKAGDKLQLVAGIYRDGLDIRNLSGSSDARISIRGAEGANRTIFEASRGRNTISIVNSSYVAISDLELAGNGMAVDGVKAEHSSRFAHHISLERLHIHGYDASQQNVAISTKCTAWNWVIRNNVIEAVGTGLYLGDSDGSAPFIRGVVDGNLIRGTLGYSIQIKHQNRWPAMTGAFEARGETVIRYNTLVKDARSSMDKQARPNLLLGHWPLAGKGSHDRYLVYGNLLVDNPHEALLQAEGNVILYNNVLSNRFGAAIAIREHNDLPRSVDVFHNTIVARGIGILLRNGDPSFVQTVSSNAIFASGVVPASLVTANAVRSFEEAKQFLPPFLVAPGATNPEQRNNLPEDGHWDPTGRASLPDAGLDFDRQPRVRRTYGAYAGGYMEESWRFNEISARVQELPRRMR